MLWRKGDEYHLISEDGRFTISKANVKGWLTYTLWEREWRPATLAEAAHWKETPIEYVRAIAPHDHAARIDALRKLKAIADERVAAA